MGRIFINVQCSEFIALVLTTHRHSSSVILLFVLDHDECYCQFETVMALLKIEAFHMR